MQLSLGKDSSCSLSSIKLQSLSSHPASLHQSVGKAKIQGQGKAISQRIPLPNPPLPPPPWQPGPRLYPMDRYIFMHRFLCINICVSIYRFMFINVCTTYIKVYERTRCYVYADSTEMHPRYFPYKWAVRIKTS